VCSSPILKVQLTVESKLAITMRFNDTRKATCDVDLALQDERWYHSSISVHPAREMAVFVNGVQIKYYCVENVSALVMSCHVLSYPDVSFFLLAFNDRHTPHCFETVWSRYCLVFDCLVSV
jgi:hypothetical protein